jgi:hypothetical protein
VNVEGKVDGNSRDVRPQAGIGIRHTMTLQKEECEEQRGEMEQNAAGQHALEDVGIGNCKIPKNLFIYTWIFCSPCE